MASKGHGSIITVNSTLSFLGQDRPHMDELVAGDHGKYTCVFMNEIKKVESTIILIVEHKPIMLNQYSKVTYNLRETAEMTCKVQAWPKPKFLWSFGNNAILQGSSNNHYKITTINDNDDAYISILKIMNIHKSDYGDYVCHVVNAQGGTVFTIKLQAKEAPDKPNISVMEIGPTYVALLWQIFFDGGLPITKYIVLYKIVAGDNCAPTHKPDNQWFEFDCRRMNPCNVTNLKQHQTYAFKMKVYNTKNNFNYSTEVIVTTTLAQISIPLRASFDPKNGMFTIKVDATCLTLLIFIEEFDESSSSWRIVEKWPLKVVGNALIQKKKPLDDSKAVKSQFRIKLCLKADLQKCSKYTEVKSKF